MREAARNWLRARARSKHSSRPLTGLYFWVPLPTQHGGLSWQVKEFFEGWLPSSDHAFVWLHVRDVLEHRWKRSLKHVGYCCLPRGRVCETHFGQTTEKVIYHGNDCPVGLVGLNLVRHKFNLAPLARAVFDEHLQRLFSDAQSLVAILESGLTSSDCGGRVLRLFQPGQTEHCSAGIIYKLLASTRSSSNPEKPN